jgi:hypothetical protein
VRPLPSDAGATVDPLGRLLASLSQTTKSTSPTAANYNTACDASNLNGMQITYFSCQPTLKHFNSLPQQTAVDTIIVNTLSMTSWMGNPQPNMSM